MSSLRRRVNWVSRAISTERSSIGGLEKVTAGRILIDGRDVAAVPRLLAIRHVQGAPGEAAIALCGIVASTALMIAMATMVTSFRGAVDDWLGQVLSADLYLRADGGNLKIVLYAAGQGANVAMRLPRS